jgi:chemotaxis protein MotA
VLWGIYLGGSFSAFVDMPSIVIVFGGCFAATLMRFSLMNVVGALASGGKIAFAAHLAKPRDLVDQVAEISDIMRKQGPLGLENFETDDPFMRKGMQLIADGYEGAFIREALERERDLNLNRLSEGQRIFKSIGDAAPAFGMIGTLIGLVQMLGTMDDPSKIGPAMAVAILTTLYGAVVQNVICIPIADKLGSRFDETAVNQTLMIDGLLMVRENKSPTVVREILLSYLPEKLRDDDREAA